MQESLRTEMTHGNDITLIPGRDVGELTRLQPLAERAFGGGDRPDGWFSRKLLREAIDPDLTVVAVDRSLPAVGPGDPSPWCGYLLVGRPH